MALVADLFPDDAGVRAGVRMFLEQNPARRRHCLSVAWLIRKVRGHNGQSAS
mgnify:CR=1 FL=1